VINRFSSREHTLIDVMINSHSQRETIVENELLKKEVVSMTLVIENHRNVFQKKENEMKK